MRDFESQSNSLPVIHHLDIAFYEQLISIMLGLTSVFRLFDPAIYLEAVSVCWAVVLGYWAFGMEFLLKFLLLGFVG